MILTVYTICMAYGKEQLESSAQRPNILFILIDDLGWNDVGFNGSSFYETPNIDRLANRSLRFDWAYASSPMCSPTRVSIMTGKSPARTGVTQWLPGYQAKDQELICAKTAPGMRMDELTLAEALRNGGYITAFMGKWHMGPLHEGGPENHGFDIFKAVIETNRCSQFYPFRQEYPTVYFPDAKVGDNYTDKLTDEALKFIGQHKEKPFFLFLSHFAMHAPIKSKEHLRQKFAEKAAKLPIQTEEEASVCETYSSKPLKSRQDDPEYAGELETLDNNIGRLMQMLEATGLDENTIVILTSDNGGRTALQWREHPTSVQPLRGGKTFLFDGGIRIPLLVRCPGITNKGGNCVTPVVSTDFYPTVMELVGLPLDPSQHEDGVSIVPLLKGRMLKRNEIYWHFPHYQGEGGYPASAIRSGDYKLIINYHFDDVLLFNLNADPYEKNNLAESQPRRMEKMNRLLHTWLEETGAKIPMKNPNL